MKGSPVPFPTGVPSPLPSSHPVSARTASTHSRHSSESISWPGLNDTSGGRAKSAAFSARPIPDRDASHRKQGT